MAILSVLLYHAEVGWTSGGYVGVDVFFVISGYLITGLIVRELEHTSSVSLTAFYGRRMRRLLPAIVVVLATVVVLAIVLYTAIEQRRTAGDVLSAALYYVNWRLAAQAVDYGAEGASASPLQHFWSLSVEEQFYIVWPALLLGTVTLWRRVTGAGRHLAVNVRPVIAGLVGVVIVASFLHSLTATADSATTAYFSTFTRAWELALGAAVALTVGWAARIPRPVASVLAWTGLIAILWSVVQFDDATPFPGTAALVPTLGAAALILAGSITRPAPLSVGLGIRPMRHIGRLSYSWYLWHWPLLVFAAVAWGELTTAQALLVTAAAYVPALLTHLWVEYPVHHSPRLARPARALAVGIGCTMASVGLALLLAMVVPEQRAASADDAPGARSVEPGALVVQERADAVRPTPLDAYDDQGQANDDGCLLEFDPVELAPCLYGDTEGDTTVMLIGDSTATHYFPALDLIAEERGWRLITLGKAGCSLADYPKLLNARGREYTECYEWRDRVFDRIDEESPEMVVLAGRTDNGAYVDGEELSVEESAPIIEAGWVDTFRRVDDTGAQVVLMASGVVPKMDVPTCVEDHMDDLLECATARRVAVGYEHSDVLAAEQVPDVQVIDFVPLVCDDEVCPGVIGNVLVYRQNVHFTATFMETMTDHLASELPEL